MATVIATIDVGRPAEEVFAYATDPGRFHEWQDGVVEGHSEPSQAGVGDRCVTVRKIGFAERAFRSEITRLDPPTGWTIAGLDGPIRARVDVDISALDDKGARLTIAIDFRGHGVGRALVPMIVVPAARREMPRNLERLRARLERA